MGSFFSVEASHICADVDTHSGLVYCSRAPYSFRFLARRQWLEEREDGLFPGYHRAEDLDQAGGERNQATANPQQTAHDKGGPAPKSQLRDEIVEWLRRYWNTPREKTKWPDIAAIILTLVVAIAAIWSAFIFQ